MSVNIGDKVQIKDNGMDVTNGIHAKANRLYGQGGPLWATVVSIDEEWHTGGKYGLPEIVTKVRCSGSNDIIVWQVQPEDIYTNIIKPTDVSTLNKLAEGLNEIAKIKPVTTPSPTTTKTTTSSNTGYSTKNYITDKDSSDWGTGYPTVAKSAVKSFTVPVNNAKNCAVNSVSDLGSISRPNGYAPTVVAVDTEALQFKTAWENAKTKRQMLNQDSENIQNSYKFPAMATQASESAGIAARYDYRIINDDDRYQNIDLENRLRDARAALGIPISSSSKVNKTMKMYMYNRFKVPDPTLAHNKSFTHVFFTRPDCNLLLNKDTITTQARNHTEAAMLWRQHPELFRLLSDSRRIQDGNNFNLLLSNQVASFEIIDETLSTIEAGRSWNEHQIVYGDAYTGRTAGEFSCLFNELADYSIIKLLKLWITYIDNVARGAWRPSYDLDGSGGVSKMYTRSHVYTRTLDYASSCYVIKTAANGEDILYVSKYYGIIPINTSANSLSWSSDNNANTGTPKLNVRFKYSYKRDLSPVSLLEFNYNSNSNDGVFVDSYAKEYAGSVRPFVGVPFIEMNLNSSSNPIVRLKFRPYENNSSITDDTLFKANL